MSKPQFHHLFDKQVAGDGERVLVTLLRGLGPWRDSVFLVGGLAPAYIVRRRPPDVPTHAGTGDVDVVVDLAMLADTEAYRSLEKNLKAMGFERGQNDAGQAVNWRWKMRMEHGGVLILEFLADDPKLRGGKIRELPTEGNVSAVNIPYAAMVFDLHDTIEIEAELLGGGGLTTQKIAYANIVSFTCLKVFAFDHRNERKDAHDLVYCLEHIEGGVEAAAQAFTEALTGPHREPILKALALLRRHFAPDPDEGYLQNGPVAVALFELTGADDLREQRLLRQRIASDVIARLLSGVAEHDGQHSDQTMGSGGRAAGGAGG